MSNEQNLCPYWDGELCWSLLEGYRCNCEHKNPIPKVDDSGHQVDAALNRGEAK